MFESYSVIKIRVLFREILLTCTRAPAFHIDASIIRIICIGDIHTSRASIHVLLKAILLSRVHDHLGIINIHHEDEAKACETLEEQLGRWIVTNLLISFVGDSQPVNLIVSLSPNNL